MKLNSQQSVLTPLFYEEPPILPTPTFVIFCPPPPNLTTHCSLSCLAFLAGWVIAPHLMCYFT